MVFKLRLLLKSCTDLAKLHATGCNFVLELLVLLEQGVLLPPPLFLAGALLQRDGAVLVGAGHEAGQLAARHLGRHQPAVEPDDGIEHVSGDRPRRRARAQGGVADEAGVGVGRLGETGGDAAAGVAQRQGLDPLSQNGPVLVRQGLRQGRVDQGLQPGRRRGVTRDSARPASTVRA